MKLTRDQSSILASLARGYSCWICQDILASLAALGLAEVVDTCAMTDRRKYAITDAGRDEVQRRAA